MCEGFGRAADDEKMLIRRGSGTQRREAKEVASKKVTSGETDPRASTTGASWRLLLARLSAAVAGETDDDDGEEGDDRALTQTIISDDHDEATIGVTGEMEEVVALLMVAVQLWTLLETTAAALWEPVAMATAMEAAMVEAIVAPTAAGVAMGATLMSG